MAISQWASRDWLLLPGTLCTGAVFDEFLNALDVPAQRRQVVEMAAPSIDDYADIVDAAKGAVVCGFSLGAIVAAHYADQMQAAAVLLFGVNPRADDPAKAAGRKAMANDVTTRGGAVAMNGLLPNLHGPHTEQTRTKILQMADDTTSLIAAQTTLAMSRPGALDQLSRTSYPVHALTGSEDTYAPPALGQEAAAAAPNGRFHLLKGLGHYALLEDPQACADALLAAHVTA